MTTKPHLRVVDGRPVVVQERESKIDAARRRYGKAFCHEKGSTFRSSPNPTVLTDWLGRRLFDKSTSTSGKEKA